MASTDSKREAAVEHSESFDCPDLPCKAVTVYSDRAEVKRFVACTLKAGSNEVLIKKLPSSVDSESIRVEGRGNASICKVQYQEKHVKKGEDIRHRQKICEDQLEKLNEDRDKVEAEMKRLQRQREVLDGIAQQISRGSRREEEKDKSKGFLMEAENLESLEKFLNFYENKVGQLDDSIRVVAKKLAKIDEEIDVVKKNIRDLSGGSAGSFLCREVSIIVETSETCDVELDVSYVVSNAMWTPSYDFRVLSDASSMKVHYYGMIQQNSGEDWVDTTLSLSTAKPSIGGQVPELRTQRVSIYHVRDFVKLMDPTFGACFTFNWNMTKNLTTSRAGPMYGLRVLLFVNGSEYLPTTEAAGVRITVHEKTDYPFPDTFGYSAPTGFISSFGIRLKRVIRLPAPFGTCVERENIKTDYIYEGFDYSVEGCFRTCFQQLVTRECGCCDPRFPQLPGYKHCAVEDPYSKPAFEYETVPSKTPYAFLKARVTNKSAYPFLPGPISVFLDNNFVAKSHLAAVSPLEEFTCSLGIDPAVRVEYKPIHKYREESGLWTKSTLTTYEQKIEIKNTRVGEKRAKVKLLEHVPLSGGKKVKVNLLEPHIPKHDKEAEKLSYRLNKDRNLEWDLRVDPGETKVVTVKYTIEHPKNDVIEFSED